MGKFVPIITNQTGTGAYGGNDGFTTASTNHFSSSTYPREAFNRNNEIGWGSKSGDRLAWLRVWFPVTYTPKKFTISTPTDAVMTKKTPTQFKVYGIRENYRNIHDIQFPYNVSITVEPDFLNSGCDLLLEVNEGIGFWSPNQTKEWIINNGNKKYIGFYIYMYGKEESWTGAMEYFVGEVQMYSYKNDKDFAVIRRSADGKYVSVQKKRIHAGVFTANDLNEERERFNMIKGYKNIRNPFRAYMNATDNLVMFSEQTFSKGKWYYEVKVSYRDGQYGVATTHMLGWHSKSEVEYRSTPFVGDGVYYYCLNGDLYGAIEQGRSYPYTRSSLNVDRIGVAIDLDNDFFEIYLDGAPQGRAKIRSMGKPLIPAIAAGNSDVGEITIVEKPKHLPKGYMNVVNKRDYEDIVVRLDSAPTLDDYKKYGIKEGETIDFEKPYNKLRVFTENLIGTANGKIHSFRIVPSTETIKKIRIEV